MNSESPRFVRSMFLTLAMMAGVLLLNASRGTAQTTSASINGTVTDKSGAVLPGVTVTAASPALQIGKLSAVTDGKGDYRLSPLPIGTYSLTFVLDGFGTAQQA